MAEQIASMAIKVGTEWWELGEMLSDVQSKNELSYQASPTRSTDMTLNNDEVAFYVPTVTVKFAYVDANDFAKLMQVVNSKGFFARYWDFELAEEVVRRMYVSERSLEKLYVQRAYLEGLVGVSLTMVSKYGYAYTLESDENYKEDNKFHYYQLHFNANERRGEE